MTTIMFVPGILGSELYKGDERVWPPTFGEVFIGYQRLEALMDSSVRAGQPISNVFAMDVYGALLKDLESIAASTESHLVKFGYDWRKSIAESAKFLGKKIEAVLTERDEAIALVAHSMGGLVCRYLLESGEFAEQPWFQRIERFIGLAVPNLGSPLALVRALGLKGAVKLSGSDIVTISSDPRYPSLYQLVPPADQSVLWQIQGSEIEELDHFSDPVVDELQLSLENVATARQTWERLNLARKPATVEYVFMGGTGHKTVTRIDLGRRGRPKPVAGEDVGDGTVSLWSSIQSQHQNAVSPGSHEGFFRNNPARKLLFELFGIRAPFRPFSAGVEQLPALDISIQSAMYAPDEEIDVMVFPLAPTARIEGLAQLERRDPSTEESEIFEPYGSGIRVLYEGPNIAFVRLNMRAPREPGAYRIRFEGTHALSNDRDVSFFVTAEDD